VAYTKRSKWSKNKKFQDVYSIPLDTVNKTKVCCVYATLRWHTQNHINGLRAHVYSQYRVDTVNKTGVCRDMPP